MDAAHVKNVLAVSFCPNRRLSASDTHTNGAAIVLILLIIAFDIHPPEISHVWVCFPPILPSERRQSHPSPGDPRPLEYCY